jgi:hypothetical protein
MVWAAELKNSAALSFYEPTEIWNIQMGELNL